jgi:prevent-host-death family protein
MPKPINIHEAKTHLSRLVEQASLGKEIIIAKAGKPMARLVPLAAAPRPKKFGLLEGRFKIPDNFDAPLDPEVLALFEGN